MNFSNMNQETLVTGLTCVGIDVIGHCPWREGKTTIEVGYLQRFYDQHSLGTRPMEAILSETSTFQSALAALKEANPPAWPAAYCTGLIVLGYADKEICQTKADLDAAMSKLLFRGEGAVLMPRLALLMMRIIAREAWRRTISLPLALVLMLAAIGVWLTRQPMGLQLRRGAETGSGRDAYAKYVLGDLNVLSLKNLLLPRRMRWPLPSQLLWT